MCALIHYITSKKKQKFAFAGGGTFTHKGKAVFTRFFFNIKASEADILTGDFSHYYMVQYISRHIYE
jgi:hypothetical protein